MKKISFVLLSFFLLIYISGCGIEQNEPDLMSDLSKQELYTQEDINITSVETIKRNTDAEAKKDEIYVKVTGGATGVKCDLQYKLVYNYYTEGGWVLDECKPYNTNEWKVIPTTGVDEKTLNNYVTNVIERGGYGESYFDDGSIVSLDLNLLEKTHIISMEFSKKQLFRDVIIKSTLTYAFYNMFNENNTYCWGWEVEDDSHIAEQNYSKMEGVWIGKHQYSTAYPAVCLWKITVIDNNTIRMEDNLSDYILDGYPTENGVTVTRFKVAGSKNWISTNESYLKFKSDGTLELKTPRYDELYYLSEKQK